MSFTKILTKELMQAVLHKKVEEIKITNLTLPGNNFMGNLYRVIATSEKCKIISVVCKFMPDFLKESTAHVREIEMYTKTLPEIYVLVEKAWPDVEFFAPKSLFSNDDVLILEDLDVSGYTTLTRGITLDMEHSLLVLKKLASFHAASVILHINNPESMKHYEKSVFDDPLNREGVMRFFTAMMTTLADVVDEWPDCSIYADKVRSLSSRLLDKLIAASQCNETTLNVLNHCDLWVNNLMFKYDEDKVQNVKLIDFQMVQFTTPAVDLLYFIHTSPSHQVHKDHSGTLLQAYHSELTSALCALNYPKPIITFEELEEEYRKRIAYGAFATFIDLPIMCYDGDFDLHLAMSKGTIPGKEMFDQSTYREILEYRLQVFDRLGLFE